MRPGAPHPARIPTEDGPRTAVSTHARLRSRLFRRTVLTFAAVACGWSIDVSPRAGSRCVGGADGRARLVLVRLRRRVVGLGGERRASGPYQRPGRVLFRRRLWPRSSCTGLTSCTSFPLTRLSRMARPSTCSRTRKRRPLPPTGSTWCVSAFSGKVSSPAPHP